MPTTGPTEATEAAGTTAATEARQPGGQTGGPDEASSDDLRRLVRRGRVVTVVVLSVLVVLVVVTATAGGFARRTDGITPAEPGEELTTGPYVLTFTSGTVQHRRSDDTWQVVVSGSARTTDDTSDAIPGGGGTSAFVYGQDVGTRRVEEVADWSYGPVAEGRSHRYLVPGAGAVELRATFAFPTQPQGKLRLVVLDQEYGKAYVFGDEEAWQAGRTGRDLAIPLEVLAEADY